jgi:glutaredoxin-like protein
MPLIQKREADLLRERLRSLLEGPVRIDLWLREEVGHFRAADSCGTCAETRQLLEELTALCARLELRVRAMPAGGKTFGDALPAIELSGAARGCLRYLGIPIGNELTTLLEDLVDVSRGSTDLPDEVRAALQALREPLHLALFVTPDCPRCPPLARLVHKLAVEGERVTAEVIDAGEFPELARRHGVESVPSLVVNGRLARVGSGSERQFLASVLRAAAPEAGAPLGP